VEEAARGIAVSAEQHSEEGGVEGDTQIILVRPRIVETVGHVLGNLFQRMYHLTSQARDAAPDLAEELEGNIRGLEDFLQLALDYFSPIALALQYVPGTDVAQSLARQLSETTGCPVKIDVKLLADGQLLVDPGRLARTFGLLASQLGAKTDGHATIELKAVARPPGRAMTLSVVVPHCVRLTPSSQSEMRWAVAEKFLELHGGALQETTKPSGEVLWELVLPLQP